MRRYLFVVILWVLFALGCVLAPVLAIFYALLPQNHYLRRVVKAADRLIAAILGYSGKFTASVESATEPRLEWLRYMLDEIEEDHCKKEAIAEHAYCSIIHRNLGDK
jgi:hypothetical protein